MIVVALRRSAQNGIYVLKKEYLAMWSHKYSSFSVLRDARGSFESSLTMTGRCVSDDGIYERK